MYRTCWGKRRERGHWGDLGADGWNNIRMDLKKVGCGFMGWIGLPSIGTVGGRL